MGLGRRVQDHEVGRRVASQSQVVQAERMCVKDPRQVGSLIQVLDADGNAALRELGGDRSGLS